MSVADTCKPAQTLITLLPKASGGVWDFAHTVAGELGTLQHVIAVARGDTSRLGEAGNAAVLLHYSGYGYATRGAPVWLAQAVSEHRPRFKSLAVFFHELYALGPPWSSAFWLSPTQRHVARRLAQLADCWLTTCDKYANWLSEVAGDKPHAVLPISSNIGELETISAARRPIAVVFGTPSLRAAAYRAGNERLFSWTRAQGLEIHDIGQVIPERAESERLRRAGVVQHGRLAATEASALMATARYGIVKHRAEELAKSGIFAGYCAHGICPIVLANDYGPADGLQPGVHYLPGLPGAPSSSASAAPCETVGRSAWLWYSGHRIAQHAATLAALMSLETIA